MSSLYHLKDSELPPEIATRLAPFIAAWRPHSRPPLLHELQEAGYTRVHKDSFSDELEDVYFALRNCTPEEWIESHPNDQN